MFTRLMIALFGVALPSLVGLAQTEQPIERASVWVEVIKRATAAVVTIETNTGQGSGFLVNSNGTLVTNRHVMSGASGIVVKLASGESFNRVHVLHEDENRDLALLRIEGVDLPFIPLANSNEVNVGDEVVLVGAPKGLEQTVSNGIVSGIRLTDTGTKVLQTSAAASPGSSGGPLVNSRGEAIGVLSFKVAQGENLNFTIPSNYVRGVLEALSLASANPLSRVLETKKLSAGKRGVMLTGYGTPGESFQYIFIELMNFLAEKGVQVANDPGKFGPVEDSAVALPIILDRFKESSADLLLYITLNSGWNQVDRLTVQCFDRSGKQLWKEDAASAMAMSLKGAANALLRRIKPRLASRFAQIPNPADAGKSDDGGEHE